jgi:hypothetical protein
MAAVRNCYILADEGFGKTRKFCPPCAVEHLPPVAVQRSGFGVGLGNCGAGWSLSFLEMAGGLGGQRPFPSAKAVDVKRCRLVDFLGNHEALGKNGRLFWHNIMEGERPFASNPPNNSHRPIQPSQLASA